MRAIKAVRGTGTPSLWTIFESTFDLEVAESTCCCNFSILRFASSNCTLSPEFEPLGRFGKAGSTWKRFDLSVTGYWLDTVLNFWGSVVLVSAT